MMMMVMMLNYFCGMVDQWKTFSLISSRDHRQRSSPLWISDTPRARFEPAQSLSWSFVEWSCIVVITTTLWRHYTDGRLLLMVSRYIKDHRISGDFWNYRFLWDYVILFCIFSVFHFFSLYKTYVKSLKFRSYMLHSMFNRSSVRYH